ncbi:hypothetical protein [Pedobacter mendelii]|nr:hypothetical protein [Pedobacter mendelii]
MKKLIYTPFTCLIILISACNDDSKTISIDETKTVEINTEPKIKYATSIIIGKNDVILYPLNLNDGEYDSYKSRSGETNYWNLIFYNVNTGKSELLTKDKLVINSFRIGNTENGPNNSATLSDSFIYYEITNSDFDADKKLTSKDPKKLFISNLEGKSFIQLSPENFSLLNWKIDVKHDLILMDLIKDDNGDKEFNEKDEVEYFIYNLKSGTAAKPILDKAFKKEVTELAKKVL